MATFSRSAMARSLFFVLCLVSSASAYSDGVSEFPPELGIETDLFKSAILRGGRTGGDMTIVPDFSSYEHYYRHGIAPRVFVGAQELATDFQPQSETDFAKPDDYKKIVEELLRAVDLPPADPDSAVLSTWGLKKQILDAGKVRFSVGHGIASVESDTGSLEYGSGELEFDERAINRWAEIDLEPSCTNCYGGGTMNVVIPQIRGFRKGGVSTSENAVWHMLATDVSDLTYSSHLLNQVVVSKLINDLLFLRKLTNYQPFVGVPRRGIPWGVDATTITVVVPSESVRDQIDVWDSFDITVFEPDKSSGTTKLVRFQEEQALRLVSGFGQSVFPRTFKPPSVEGGNVPTVQLRFLIDKYKFSNRSWLDGTKAPAPSPGFQQLGQNELIDKLEQQIADQLVIASKLQRR